MRFSLRRLMIVVVFGGALAGLVLRHYLSQPSGRYIVIGPVTSGGAPSLLNPPFDAEVVQAIRRDGGPLAVVNVSAKVLLDETIGPVVQMPIVGPSRLHTATYRYLVQVAGRQRLILVDHNHLHMTPPIQR
jgi:hypothetical protein